MEEWYRSVSFPQYEVSDDYRVRRRSNGHVLKQYNPGSVTLSQDGAPQTVRVEDLFDEATDYGEDQYVHYPEDYEIEEWYQSVTFPEYDVSTRLGVRRHSSLRPLSESRSGVYRLRCDKRTLSIRAIDLLAEVMNGQHT